MKKSIIILFVSFALNFSLIAQLTVGTTLTTNNVSNGYTLFSPNFSFNTYLIDNCGYKMHTWHSEYNPNLSVYLLENGNLLRSTKKQGIKGCEILDWQSNVVWSYTASPSLDLHHDIEMLPNVIVEFKKKLYLNLLKEIKLVIG